jgi:hypothetical protein
MAVMLSAHILMRMQSASHNTHTLQALLDRSATSGFVVGHTEQLYKCYSSTLYTKIILL